MSKKSQLFSSLAGKIGKTSLQREEAPPMHTHSEPPHGEPDFTPTYKEDRPYWRRAHLDWRVWVAAAFIFAALAIYVVTVDLSLVPRIRH